MLKAYAGIISFLAIATDVFVIIVALAVAWIYQHSFGVASGNSSLFWLAAVLAPIWLYLLNHFHSKIRCCQMLYSIRNNPREKSGSATQL